MNYTVTAVKDTDSTLEFGVLPPLFLPFHCVDYENAYYFYKPFDFDPFKIWTLTCSGSPVIVAHNFFVGFLNETGGRFAFNGAGKLTVSVPAGQEVLYAEGNPYEAWREYNRIILSRRNDPVYPVQDFWKGLEYCTWNDQKFESDCKVPKGVPFHGYRCLNEDYIYNYLRRIEKLNLPAGKITIDEGWDDRGVFTNKPYVMGNYDIDRTRFPHWEQMLKDIAASGFIPALWYSPFLTTENSRIAQKYPHLVSENYEYKNGDKLGRRFFADDDVLDAHYRETLSKYMDMGIRKFKCDLSYGPKDQMKALMKRVYRIAKELDPTVEIEMHMPDIFVSRYADVVRINDVAFDQGEWRGATIEHYRVCRLSTDRILNLDHLATNSQGAPRHLGMEHVRMEMALAGGYPVVSLLPDRFPDMYRDEFCELLRNWTYKEADLF